MTRAIYVLLAVLLTTPVFAEKEPPVAVRTVAPDYPEEMRRSGISGVVMVNCVIDEKGNVTEPSVEKSTAPAFEAPAIAALKRWKFKPAKQDGVVVAIKVCIPVKFVLAD